MEITDKDTETFVLIRKKLQEIFDERDYYKSTLHELANGMDKNIIDAYQWKACATQLYSVLEKYIDHDGLPKDTVLYRKSLDAVIKYEKLLVDNKE